MNLNTGAIPASIQKLPLRVVVKMKPLKMSFHLCDVVQGLIENSIDSGSTSISIYIENHGLSSIKVIDNGHGISLSSLPFVCRFNYTSKFHGTEEISKIETFGFHGMFLANLSCASTINIWTKTKNDAHTYSATYQFNTMIKQAQQTDTVQGTTVDVVNFLSNFPDEREKVEKSAKEIKKMLNVIAKYSCAYSWIKFEVYLHDKVYLKTQGSSDLFTNFSAFCNSLNDPRKLFIANRIYSQNDVSASFFVANPRLKNFKVLRAIFLNGRLISSKHIKKALESYFDQFYSNSKIPYIIMLSTPSEDLFTNVFDQITDIKEQIYSNNYLFDNIYEIENEKIYWGKANFNPFQEIIDGCISTINENSKDELKVEDIRALEETIFDSLKMKPKELSKFLFQLQSVQEQVFQPMQIAPMPISQSGIPPPINTSAISQSSLSQQSTINQSLNEPSTPIITSSIPSNKTINPSLNAPISSTSQTAVIHPSSSQNTKITQASSIKAINSQISNAGHTFLSNTLPMPNVPISHKIQIQSQTQASAINHVPQSKVSLSENMQTLLATKAPSAPANIVKTTSSIVNKNPPPMKVQIRHFNTKKVQNQQSQSGNSQIQKQNLQTSSHQAPQHQVVQIQKNPSVSNSTVIIQKAPLMPESNINQTQPQRQPGTFQTILQNQQHPYIINQVNPSTQQTTQKSDSQPQVKKVISQPFIRKIIAPPNPKRNNDESNK